MQPYWLDVDEETNLDVLRGPDGFEWWFEEVDTEDIQIGIVLAELNMLYSIIGGTDDGTV